MTKRMNIGELLVAMGLITEQQLAYAVQEQQRWGRRLGHLIAELGFCTEDQVLSALAQQARLLPIDLRRFTPEPEALARVPSALMLEHSVVPLRVTGARGEVLDVAIAAPGSVAAIDAVRAASGCRRVNAYVALDSAIE